MATSVRILKPRKLSWFASSTLNRLNSSKSRNRNKHAPFAVAEQRYAEKDEPSLGDDPNDPEYVKYSQKPHPETVTKHHPDMLANQPVKGKIFEKLPFRIYLEAGKMYSFCTCGYSKNQPFCDSSHKAPNFMSTRPHHIRFRPLPFKVDESKEYWLCMCKQSNNRPFCDGSHKRPEIQGAVKG
ncbi:CDGSH iron sulfur domain-containing protein 3, mitochondrial [Elysia marginata]|uniref:CDGSH iron sulfur domain-containing protein 3, mitochondrial n=1 Tax=Elysia marginata TaxID=1093978 RepID=A0AAV4J2U4_9GAST|nr:CDGSH iron sulfur domain-containing protein 3, mitochondrial [Elysia marginata]